MGIPLKKCDDSRGLILRTFHHIKEIDPEAYIRMQYIDLTLDNIRDLLKYSKTEMKKVHTGGLGLSSAASSNRDSHNEQFGSTRSVANHDLHSVQQAQAIERDFIELHQRPSPQGQPVVFLKNVTQVQVTDLIDAALLIDKCHEMSATLSKKLNYLPSIRSI